MRYRISFIFAEHTQFCKTHDFKDEFITIGEPVIVETGNYIKISFYRVDPYDSNGTKMSLVFHRSNLEAIFVKHLG